MKLDGTVNVGFVENVPGVPNALMTQYLSLSIVGELFGSEFGDAVICVAKRPTGLSKPSVVVSETVPRVAVPLVKFVVLSLVPKPKGAVDATRPSLPSKAKSFSVPSLWMATAYAMAFEYPKAVVSLPFVPNVLSRVPSVLYRARAKTS